MKKAASWIGLTGIALVTATLVYHGMGHIMAALATAGIGLVWASLFHIVPMSANAIAWRGLFVRRPKPSFRRMLYAVWIRESVNGLLPVARVGGEAASYRELHRFGIGRTSVIGSLIADMTLTLVTQFLFTVAGLVLLLLRVDDTAPIWRILLGLLIFLPMVGGLFAMQRYGLVRIGSQIVSKLFGPRWAEQIGSALSLDRMVRLIYRRPSRVIVAVGGQLAGWLLGVGEIWLALFYLGSPVPLGDALVIESLTQALSAIAFLIPGAIGVQEGGFVVFCTLLGLPADIGLALALARRFRDLLIFVPGLIAWQVGEAGNLVFGKPAAQRRRRSKRSPAERRPTDTEHPRHDRALLLAHAQRPQDHHLP